MILDQIIPVLQLSIGPVILISGAGLVLLSMTNRYGRVIDRSRNLAESLRSVSEGETERFRSQILILIRRARLLRMAIAFTSASLLLAAVLIIALFLVALLNLHAVSLIIILFTACMFSLILGLIVFLIDVNVSLSALKLEVNVKSDSSSS
jgi:hypothetical protein